MAVTETRRQLLMEASAFLPQIGLIHFAEGEFS
jgi:hypothetical protein